LQGEVQGFYLKLRGTTNAKQSAELDQLISAVRSAMHAAKSIKDISTNIRNLRQSSKDIKYKFFIHHKKETEQLYGQLHKLLHQKRSVSFKKLQEIFTGIQETYSSALQDFYKDAKDASVEDMDLTTALNFNRELFTSNKAMLMAVKDLRLEEKEAKDFNEVPVYRT
jgi:phosphate:Na+ symporter